MRIETLRAGFDVLFRASLSLQPDDELLVVYDESLLPFWDAFLSCVVSLDCHTTLINVPLAYQEKISREVHGPRHFLPLGLGTAIDESDVIVTILAGDINLAGGREAIVNKAIGGLRADNRFAHIPGISFEVLEVLTCSPIEDIEHDCEMLAWALGEGLQATLLTRDHTGREHTLECDLGGWFNEPLMSPGIIRPSSWGNLPPGETFCCPAPRGVTGTIAINGSIPDCVCARDEDIVLDFREGKLVQWSTRSDRLSAFFARQQQLALSRNDKDWNTFAELGVGVNPAISHLTGNSLFDEKASGTVHIAIGANRAFGHGVQSHIHVDLVTKGPTLLIDGRPVMEHGVLKRDTVATWRSSLPVAPVDASAIAQLRVRMETFGGERSGDAFTRRLHSRGRTGFVEIASHEDARVLRRLQGLLPGDGCVPGPLPELAAKVDTDGKTVARLLGLLAHYQMIYVSPDPLMEGPHAHRYPIDSSGRR